MAAVAAEVVVCRMVAAEVKTHSLKGEQGPSHTSYGLRMRASAQHVSIHAIISLKALNQRDSESFKKRFV